MNLQQFIIIVLIFFEIFYCQQYQVREAMGKRKGVIEISTVESGQWSPICSKNIDYETAVIMCKQLGYDYANPGYSIYDYQSCQDTTEYQDSYPQGFRENIDTLFYGVDISYGSYPYGLCDTTQSLTNCLKDTKEVQWGLQSCQDSANNCFYLDCIFNDENGKSQDVSPTSHLYTGMDPNSNGDGDLDKDKKKYEVGDLKLKEGFVLYYNGNEEWQFVCGSFFFEKEDHGDYLCEELGYHSSTKTEQTECQFDIDLKISTSQYKDYDCDTFASKPEDCKFKSSSCTSQCLKLKCKDTPWAQTKEGIIVISGIVLFVWVIFCFVYNKRHNAQLKERWEQNKHKYQQQEQLEKNQQQFSTNPPPVQAQNNPYLQQQYVPQQQQQPMMMVPVQPTSVIQQPNIQQPNMDSNRPLNDAQQQQIQAQQGL